ncbi:MAG: DUF2378 family protein [Archangium sp.]
MADEGGGSGWFVYDHTVDSLFFKALAARITPAMKEKLKALHIDLDGKPKNVPQTDWAQALRLAADELFTGPLDERYRSLGAAVIQRFEETLMGKAIMAVMRVMGPARALRRIEGNLRGGNNFIRASLEQKGERAFVSEVNECNGNPHYIAGVIDAALHVAGAKEVNVTVLHFDGHAAKYAISWS